MFRWVCLGSWWIWLFWVVLFGGVVRMWDLLLVVVPGLVADWCLCGVDVI